VIRPRSDVTVYLRVAPVDMRKQAASLALLVEKSLQGNIFEPAIYAFANRRADRVKLIYWERNGLVLAFARSRPSRSRVARSMRYLMGLRCFSADMSRSRFDGWAKSVREPINKGICACARLEHVRYLRHAKCLECDVPGREHRGGAVAA
jgi:IS66 Orf2 like protein